MPSRASSNKVTLPDRFVAPDRTATSASSAAASCDLIQREFRSSARSVLIESSLFAASTRLVRREENCLFSITNLLPGAKLRRGRGSRRSSLAECTPEGWSESDGGVDITQDDNWIHEREELRLGRYERDGKLAGYARKNIAVKGTADEGCRLDIIKTFQVRLSAGTTTMAIRRKKHKGTCGRNIEPDSRMDSSVDHSWRSRRKKTLFSALGARQIGQASHNRTSL